MMREAQKMMADPAFQERMKQYTENEAFKASMAKTQEMLKDEKKVKELEETMKKRVEMNMRFIPAIAPRQVKRKGWMMREMRNRSHGQPLRMCLSLRPSWKNVREPTMIC